MKFIDWCFLQHKERGKPYDDYLPYEFHLRMVQKVNLRFDHIAHRIFSPDGDYADVITQGCFGHDTMEDTGVTYNDILAALKEDNIVIHLQAKEVHIATAEIIRACTSDIRGRNRKERMTPAVYKDIRETKGATYVKLCDRIANVLYGTEIALYSTMPTKYKEEMPEFKRELFSFEYEEMFVYLQQLLETV